MAKRNKLIYWIATGLLAVGMLQSGIFSVLQTKEWVDLVTNLGYPVYFLTIIGTAKILGVMAVALPRFKRLNEWAYAGFFFAMAGALFSHLAVGDYAPKAIAGPSFQLLFIALSWYFRPEDRKIVPNPLQTR